MTTVHRNAVRAILLTPEGDLLLMRVRAPQGGEPFWITPGGGLEVGETVEDGLRRELMEELGIEGFAIGPVLCRRRHTFTWGDRRICQCEEYRAVHVDRFGPVLSDAVEAQTVEHFEWWPLEAIKRSTDTFTPSELAEIVGRYLLEGPPNEPPEVEVILD